MSQEFYIGLKIGLLAPLAIVGLGVIVYLIIDCIIFCITDYRREHGEWWL